MFTRDLRLWHEIEGNKTTDWIAKFQSFQQTIDSWIVKNFRLRWGRRWKRSRRRCRSRHHRHWHRRRCCCCRCCSCCCCCWNSRCGDALEIYQNKWRLAHWVWIWNHERFHFLMTLTLTIISYVFNFDDIYLRYLCFLYFNWKYFLLYIIFLRLFSLVSQWI